ncbi:hypothetical protein N7495_005074 [Penicillium taxi]|uniref:uncharacterized protein n=1 Tax=Penicillium taxi TaxID=168475 RepID=UPI00254542D1|nr:uncharacterized protein N7495_005074 [Penicillium taxi]KAJ5893383.1 hypothetical protein N7495_005074 [Penicillium taxi]
MNSSENPDSTGPDSPPAKQAADTSEIQEATPGSPSQHDFSSTIASPSGPSDVVEGANTSKKHLLIPIPSRRSSKTDKQSIKGKGDQAASREHGRRGSKVSDILKVRRDRSRASSRRSRRQDVVNAEKGQGTPNPSTPEMSGPKPQKKSFFSFLSCCSPPHDDGDDATLPPKPSDKLQSSPNRLPTPDKSDVHTGDSSTAESKDHPYFESEKANMTMSADKAQIQEDERAPTTTQSEETTSGPASTQVPPTSPKGGEDDAQSSTSAVTTNGVVLESESKNETTEGPAATTDGTFDKPPTDEAEASLHDEEVDNSTAVLPPPPPPPVPEFPTASSREDLQGLLPPIVPSLQGRKCLVLDLDETLVHSSFKVLERADFTIPVEIEGQYHNIYVIKRPGVDQFMKRVGELYEVVVFTASVSKYGDPLLDQLDIHNVIHHRLFRESCYNHQGNYVKDLSQVGRDLRDTIIIDNSPTSYIFHPQHAIPISSWFSDAHDNELLDLIPVLEDLAGAQVQDVSMVLDITL